MKYESEETHTETKITYLGDQRWKEFHKAHDLHFIFLLLSLFYNKSDITSDSDSVALS
jgi:hypothetical protein